MLDLLVDYIMLMSVYVRNVMREDGVICSRESFLWCIYRIVVLIRYSIVMMVVSVMVEVICLIVKELKIVVSEVIVNVWVSLMELRSWVSVCIGVMVFVVGVCFV